LRGKVIPVVDLRLRFELPETADAGRMCIVVVQVDLGAAAETLMGLVVDGVEEVANIAASDIEPPPDFGASFDAAHLLGMAKTKNGVKILLDIDKVLRPDDIAPILNCAQN
jgi:purine-binding chemotaxis protein CheW